MRYALLADIHANLAALEAVLADVARRGVDAVYHLGDLVGYGPWPNETVALVRDRCIAGVCGNNDSRTATDEMPSGSKHKDPHKRKLSQISYEWTRTHCSPETKRRLAELPFRIDLRPAGGHSPGPTLILVHGTPTLNTAYATEDRPDAFYSEMARVVGLRAGDAIAFGHSHLPWHRTIDGVDFVNAGSVGRPKDGDWRAGYVLVDIGDGAPGVEFIRVEYDVERAMQAIRANGLPEDFAEFLRTGSRSGPATREDG